MSTNFRLITIPVSHYVEKVRWALDYLQIPFQELPQMPPFHRGAVKKYGGTTVPVLIGNSIVKTDSTDILRYLDTLAPGKLYPTDPDVQELSTELETLFNLTLGVSTRRWGYSHVLTRELLYPRWTLGVPFWQKLLFPLIFPKIEPIIRENFKITATSAAKSYQEIIGVFDRVNQVLADGRKYLLGDRFSAIDITFAALAVPILQPSEQYTPSTPLDLLSAQMQADIHNCRSTLAGEFGLRLYRENRR
ncbi:MAG: glutathione S-transferase [Chamaesiphon sp.]|nr:glutathione S-transferase [Chamaesiphon sp.]